MTRDLQQCEIGTTSVVNHQGRVVNSLTCHFNVSSTNITLYYIQLALVVLSLVIMLSCCKQKSGQQDIDWGSVLASSNSDVVSQNIRSNSLNRRVNRDSGQRSQPQSQLIKSIDLGSKSSDKLNQNKSEQLIQLIGKEEKSKVRKSLNRRTLSLLSGHEKKQLQKYQNENQNQEKLIKTEDDEEQLLVNQATRTYSGRVLSSTKKHIELQLSSPENNINPANKFALKTDTSIDIRVENRSKNSMNFRSGLSEVVSGNKSQNDTKEFINKMIRTESTLNASGKAQPQMYTEVLTRSNRVSKDEMPHFSNVELNPKEPIDNNANCTTLGSIV